MRKVAVRIGAIQTQRHQERDGFAVGHGDGSAVIEASNGLVRKDAPTGIAIQQETRVCHFVLQDSHECELEIIDEISPARLATAEMDVDSYRGRRGVRDVEMNHVK